MHTGNKFACLLARLRVLAMGMHGIVSSHICHLKYTNTKFSRASNYFLIAVNLCYFFAVVVVVVVDQSHRMWCRYTKWVIIRIVFVACFIKQATTTMLTRPTNWPSVQYLHAHIHIIRLMSIWALAGGQGRKDTLAHTHSQPINDLRWKL